MIVLGVISNIILVGNLQEANRQAEHKIAKLESEKKQKKKKTAESGSDPVDHSVYSGRTGRDAVCFPQG